VLAAAFADVDWECPGILTAMTNVGDIHLDRVSQIRMDRWTAGRTALIGDAAAYVLAAAITAGGSVPAAFAHYEST
jgi:2-polyprenyl-6-methoxyphenol hydroxylase-like FAD-dependent oxidoreductase